MTNAGEVPAQEVYDLLARSNFAPTGEFYDSGEFWKHVDRGTSLSIPHASQDGYLPLSVYEHIAAYIDRYGL